MNPTIKSILESEDLPTPPGVALRLLELYGQPEVEVSEMTEVIGADPTLSAKLIEYCNSPLLGRSRPTTSIRQAIVVIGMRAVKILALSFSLVRTVPTSKHGFDYEAFWARSLAMAVVSKTFAAFGDGDGDEEFLTGLILGIGQVGLAHTFPARYAELTAEAKETGLPLTVLERREWSVDRYEISCELMKHWSFPEQLVKQVETFAKTDVTRDTAEDTKQGTSPQKIQILMLALQVVEMLFEPDLASEEVDKAKAMAENWIGIQPDQFAEVFDTATESWTDFASLLSYDATQAQTFEQLERRALKGIAQLSMGLHAENEAMLQQNAELKVSATVDSLTGLKNRRAYDEDGLGEWARSKRMQRPLALMMIDIDHFKKVNDTHGHATGDRALVAVANELKKHVRPYDLVFRFGGEEFVMMLPECDPDAAFSAANRCREAIANMEIPLKDGVLNITASFGLAFTQIPQYRALDELLQEADELLYQAKNEGRNRVCRKSSQPKPMMPGLTPEGQPTASHETSTDH